MPTKCTRSHSVYVCECINWSHIHASVAAIGDGDNDDNVNNIDGQTQFACEFNEVIIIFFSLIILS